MVKADQHSRFVAGEEWHTDVSCDERPPMGSMLYITQTPESGGGDTCFASTIRAFEALSPAMQAFLETLTATHDGAKPYTGGYGQAAPEGGWPKNVHPVVIRHPGSGKKVALSSIAASPPGSTSSTAGRATRCWSSCGATSTSAGVPVPVRLDTEHLVWTTSPPTTTRSGTIFLFPLRPARL